MCLKFFGVNESSVEKIRTIEREQVRETEREREGGETALYDKCADVVKMHCLSMENVDKMLHTVLGSV